MSEEFNLSEKQVEAFANKYNTSMKGFDMFHKEDVKEFIRLLQEVLDNKSDSFKSSVSNEWEICVNMDCINEEIDKLAGDKLT